MGKIFAWIKEHPLESGALALVAAVGIYFVLESSSSSSAAAPSSSSSTDAAAADYYQAQLQAQQLSAASAQSAQNAQLQANAQTLQAGVQNNETAAQLAAIQDQDSAAVQGANIQANANVLQTQLEADVAESNIGAQQQTEDAQTAAQVQIAEGGYDVQNNAANDQLAAISDQITGQVQQQQIQAQAQDVTTQAQVQENSDNLATVLGLVTSQNQTQEAEYADQYATQATNDQTAVDLSGQQYGYLQDETDDATDINLTALQDQTQLATQQQALNQQIVGQVLPAASYQLGHGNNASQDSAIALIESLTGNIPGSVSSIGAANTTEIGNENENAAVTGTVAKSVMNGASLLTGLFA
jgi:hypothetical protein